MGNIAPPRVVKYGTCMPRKRVIGPDRIHVDARPALDGSIVKSAERVIQIFEFFNDFQTGATVADIASALKIPQSSTSALLRSLHILGYLTFDPVSRTYGPTTRIALLGYWIDPLLVSEGPAIKMTREVAELTGLPSFLATRNKLLVQVIHQENATPQRFYGQIGSGHFLVKAATGHALICSLPDREVTMMVTATNALIEDEAERVNLHELREKLTKVRETGYSISPTHRGNFLTMAIRLPDTLRETMVLCTSGPSSILGENPAHFEKVLRNSVQKWLG